MVVDAKREVALLRQALMELEAIEAATQNRLRVLAGQHDEVREPEPPAPLAPPAAPILNHPGGVAPHPTNAHLAAWCQQNPLAGLPAPIGKKRRGIYINTYLDGRIRMAEWNNAANAVTHTYIITPNHQNDLIEKLQRQGRTLNDLVPGEVISCTPVINLKNTTAAQKAVGKVVSAFKKGFKR